MLSVCRLDAQKPFFDASPLSILTSFTGGQSDVDKLSKGSNFEKEPSHGGGRAFESPRAHRFFLQSGIPETSDRVFMDTRIMAKKKYNKDKKLHNFGEKLHNSGEPDLAWQETVDLSLEDEVEGGSEIYYFTDEDGNIRSREFLTEELISDEKELKDSSKRASTENLTN